MASAAICIIPARSGSSGVPGKNWEEIEGISLVARSFLHSRAIDPSLPVLLTTDSQEVVNDVARVAGFSPPILLKQDRGTIVQTPSFLLHHRPVEQATSSSKISDVLMSLHQQLDRIGKRFETWILLQPTSPFRSRRELREIGLRLAESDRTTSLVSVKEVEGNHPSRMYRLADDRTLVSLGFEKGSELLNRQELPGIYIRDGGFYLIGESLIERGVQVSDRPVGFVRDFPWTLNIDSPEDLLLARAVGRVQGEGIE